ncbi:thump domain containing protein 1-related [Anaeramoeba flamelloides]|uniref:Thump domain containing protein 1-related n=1 Tax=Anaeramoeba flamelloides TaxID=1746091 RepID=A0AAV8AIY5_9EUKA|nr:thump domain containing protein 1-related [Anaeramoeba flamelloides]
MREATKGILVSCTTGVEALCVLECFNVFNEICDRLYPNLELWKPKNFKKEKENENEQERESDNEKEKENKNENENDKEKEKEKEKTQEIDFGLAFDQELKQLQEQKKEKKYTFTSIKTPVKGLIFIEIHEEKIDPLEIVLEFFREIVETKEMKSRYIIRIFPIQYICYSDIDKILLKTKLVVEKHFGEEIKPFPYCVDCQIRANGIKKMEIIQKVADLVSEKFKVDLTNPKGVILIRTIAQSSGIAFLPKYTEYGKYNAKTLYKSVSSTQNESESETQNK